MGLAGQKPPRQTKSAPIQFDTTCEFVEQLPEFWKRTPPLALADRIERAEARIEFHVRSDHEFVVALARVKRAIPRARWRGILERLEPGNSTSCLDGPNWDPRVLGNGGVAIRNFHRVMGIDLDDGVSMSGVQRAQIRREVRTVFRRAAKARECLAMLVHHGPKGIIFSEQLPDSCDFLGQSLLFASASLVEGLRVLGAAVKSGYEVLVFRLFRDTVCVYTTYRHNDEADTVIDSFAVARFDLDFTFPADGMLAGADGWPEFVKWVNDDLDQELPYCDLPPSLRKDFRTLMTSDEPQSWASGLWEIMQQFPPLFGKDYLQPPNSGPAVPWGTGNGPCCIYSFEIEASALRLARAMAALQMEGAEPVMAPGAKGIQSVRTQYRNIADARKVGIALRRRFGSLRLRIPHLGLDHRETGAGKPNGNGAWFGFAQANGVMVLE